jgi:hypothetical protein
MPFGDDFADLQHQVERHDGELDQLLDRIEALENDLKFVFTFSESIRNQILAGANQIGNTAYDQGDAQKCADLVKRYNFKPE